MFFPMRRTERFFFFQLPWELHCWNCAFPCIKSNFLICFGRPLASIDFDYLWLYLCAPEWSNVIYKNIFVEEIVWLLGNCWVYLTLLLRSHELSASVIGRLLLANRNRRMEAAGPLTMKIWSQEMLYYQEIQMWLEEFYQKVDLVRLSWYDIHIKNYIIYKWYYQNRNNKFTIYTNYELYPHTNNIFVW